ncbi:hypothetical protein C8T65DRAFT_780726 [Cerioporus squamosus]|nr:hypothetical protein C8T65DRAFT_780726 [Cerioporus squamosus]
MPLCTTCSKSLKSEAALIQHCKDKNHPMPYVPPRVAQPPAPSSSILKTSSTVVAFKCTLCSITFNDKGSYDHHNTSQHQPKPYKCAPCGLGFSSAEALGLHYRHFPIHPKCPQCESAFIDQTQLKLHQEIHPKCVQCNAFFLNRTRLDEHFQASSNHPTCFVCREGFADDAEIDDHLSKAHLDSRCNTCKRQFRSVDDLQGHYLASYAHPHCALCEYRVR